MKKSLAMLMTLLFVLLGTTAWAQSYTAGVYTAQANGNNGPVTVEVEVSDAEILSVKVTEHAETAGLSDTPALAPSLRMVSSVLSKCRQASA